MLFSLPDSLSFNSDQEELTLMQAVSRIGQNFTKALEGAFQNDGYSLYSVLDSDVQFFLLNLQKFTPAKKNLHENVRGFRDKYQVCVQLQREGVYQMQLIAILRTIFSVPTTFKVALRCQIRY